MEIKIEWIKKLIDLKNKAKDNKIPDDIKLNTTVSALIAFIESLEILEDINNK